MATQTAKTKQVKIKKKHWLPIYAPKSFNSIYLGETLVAESSTVKAKSITTSLMVLTDDPRKQAYSVRFDVTDVKDGKAETQVIGMLMTPSAIKRLIRRHRDKISDSFILRIAGGRMVRIKPLLVTRTRASKAAQTQIRLAARERLRAMYQKMRFDDIMLDIIDMKTQRTLKDLCSKTHPIRTADIKEIVVLPDNRKITKEMEELLEKEVAEEDARRQQLASAAAAASVDEPAYAPRKRVARKPKGEDEESEAQDGDEE